MIYKNRRKFAHNEEIQNNLGIDDEAFVNLCHKLSANISNGLQKAAFDGFYGKNKETLRVFYNAIQSAFPGTEITVGIEQIDLEGEVGKNGSGVYGTITFHVDGKEVKDLYFEKPYKVFNKDYKKGMEPSDNSNRMEYDDSNYEEKNEESKSSQENKKEKEEYGTLDITM